MPGKTSQEKVGFGPAVNCVDLEWLLSIIDITNLKRF
jgi:hypothetical protein